MADNADYADRYAAQYVDGGFETCLIQIRRDRVLASVRAHPHRTILEIGCGLEPLFVHLDDFKSYTVVEPVERFAHIARTLADGSELITVLPVRLEDVQRDMHAAYDFVVLSSLLHEVAEPERLLAAVRAVCRPDTVVHVNVPNVHSFHRLLALEMGVIADVFEKSEMEERFGRHTRFDRDRLLSTLDRSGFRVLDSGSYFVKPFAHDQMDALMQRGIVGRSIVRGLAGMIKYMPDLGCEIYADAVLR